MHKKTAEEDGTWLQHPARLSPSLHTLPNLSTVDDGRLHKRLAKETQTLQAKPLLVVAIS